VVFLSNAVMTHLQDVATWPDLDGTRYRDVRPLGAGGMGRVFAAHDETLGRDVAIKVSHAPLAGSDLDARLQREARVLADLEHPGIVPVHDVGVLGDGRVFYVMKLVRGHTLAEDVGRPASESAALGVFERIADAVAFAHTRGVVHRDLKPANVMVGPFGEVLVMDWGLARILAGSSPDPAAGVRAGTPGFMAPEQSAGETVPVGPPADVYALGALLFWMLRRQTPPPDPAAVSAALRAHAPALPRRLRAIVAKCLASAPADRYPDAAGVVADLARYRAGAAVDAMPETILDRAARFGSRHLALILLLGAYVLMRAVVAFWQS
jgi:serine/threonine protein kinase